MRKTTKLMQNDECRMRNDNRNFAGKRVTVLGLGHFGGGSAVARWLVEQGARVRVSDQSSKEKLADSVALLADLPIEFRLGADQSLHDVTEADLVVASPAIPPHSPYLLAANSGGIPVTTEICLFVQRCPAKTIGVTGTKGKSTTSTLLNLMLSASRKTWFGGNIGRSLLADLPNIHRDDLVLLELSSFMLDHLGRIGLSPNVAVVTMISSDHLDWHGSQQNYIAAKANIVRHQKPGDFAVLNPRDETAMSFAKLTPATVVPVDTHARFDLKLAGEHNQLNAQTAFTAAGLFGIDRPTAQKAIADFTGLSHRLELVHESHGIRFINDSISTIPDAAIAALRSFPAGKVIQIVGGSDKKHLPIDAMCAALAEQAKAILCIGETADAIARLLPNDRAHVCQTLEAAVTQANSLATPGDIVLLSPGHPSYDQFTNFESRGAAFARLCRDG
jgi:UDP-N-acetylmuramoylalanine--D-glutamate ligase